MSVEMVKEIERPIDDQLSNPTNKDRCSTGPTTTEGDKARGFFRTKIKLSSIKEKRHAYLFDWSGLKYRDRCHKIRGPLK